jgi:hypothetical protein
VLVSPQAASVSADSTNSRLVLVRIQISLVRPHEVRLETLFFWAQCGSCLNLMPVFMNVTILPQAVAARPGL